MWDCPSDLTDMVHTDYNTTCSNKEDYGEVNVFKGQREKTGVFQNINDMSKLGSHLVQTLIRQGLFWGGSSLSNGLLSPVGKKKYFLTTIRDIHASLVQCFLQPGGRRPLGGLTTLQRGRKMA